MSVRGINTLPLGDLQAEIDRISEAEIEEIADDSLAAEPLVCVAIVTYNHGEHLKRAIDSVLSQEIEGRVEMVISDDCSTDGSREWLRDLQASHPDRVRLLLARRNLWEEVFPGSVVALAGYDRCARARYVALLEGDDYWTDPRKLQRQVDYLESHPGAAGCFTDCLLVDEEGKTVEPRPFWNKEYRSSYDQRACLLDLESSYGTATLVFRGSVLAEGLPDYFLRAGSDYLLDHAVTGHGTLDYLEGVTAAYRIHTGGTWQGIDPAVHVHTRLQRLEALWRNPEENRRYPEELAAKARTILSRLSGPAGEKDGASREVIPSGAKTLVVSESRPIEERWKLVSLLGPLLRPGDPAIEIRFASDTGGTTALRLTGTEPGKDAYSLEWIATSGDASSPSDPDDWISFLEAVLSDCAPRMSEAEKRAEAAEEKIGRLEARLERSQRDATAVVQSRSYRLGRMLLRPFALARGRASAGGKD